MHSKRMKKINKSRKRKGKIRLQIASSTETVGERIIVGMRYDVQAKYIAVCSAHNIIANAERLYWMCDTSQGYSATW